ncbi:MAG: hypothetical protein AMR96_01310 [Candidatus Adiutrix intracellularis]|nr:MAG: hypothetical protein AMR96_01310 [Candidatus Adiutrix intracellularis]
MTKIPLNNCLFFRLKTLVALLLTLALPTTCATVPGTGRSQLALVNEQELTTLAANQYSEMIKRGPLSTNPEQTALIKKVGGRISRAAENFLRNNGLAAEIPAYHWEFNLIESDQINAFCMPGGKVAFYSGILPYTRDETGVAVVMGHEVAHAIAHHSRERASQATMTNLSGNILNFGLGIIGASSLTSEAALTAYGLGSQIGIILPFSRSHESEADRIGLTLMALAGYDPAATAPFWERMSTIDTGASPTFLSTHPSNAQRIANIKMYLPGAKNLYQMTQND